MNLRERVGAASFVSGYSEFTEAFNGLIYLLSMTHDQSSWYVSLPQHTVYCYVRELEGTETYSTKDSSIPVYSLVRVGSPRPTEHCIRHICQPKCAKCSVLKKFKSIFNRKWQTSVGDYHPTIRKTNPESPSSLSLFLCPNFLIILWDISRSDL